MGMFYNFINDKDVRLIGCEAAGRGIHTGETAATISTGSLGVFHGMKSYFAKTNTVKLLLFILSAQGLIIRV